MSISERLLNIAYRKKTEALNKFWKEFYKDYPYLLLRNDVFYPLKQSDLKDLELDSEDKIVITQDFTDYFTLKLKRDA